LEVFEIVNINLNEEACTPITVSSNHH